MTRVETRPEAFRADCDQARASGKRVGLVPTMGALHSGHLSLVERARKQGCDHIALTVFVNPLQFGPHEDFERYPRTLESDLLACREAGVDTVFAPLREDMYAEGFQTHVEVEQLTLPLEGHHRPGHFRGVTTVVAKLFGLAGPCVAVFGRKDYQQFRVLARMATDLMLPIEVVGAPIVREPDGLALSSRNRYLDSNARERALGIVRGLRAAWAAHAEGIADAGRLRALALAEVERTFDSVDYVAIADPDTLAPIEGAMGPRAVLAVAARVAGTRLIDNVVLGEDPEP